MLSSLSGFRQTARCRLRPAFTVAKTLLPANRNWLEGASRFRCSPKLKQFHARVGATLLTVYGTWQREGEPMHLVVTRRVDPSGLLSGLLSRRRDFR